MPQLGSQTKPSLTNTVLGGRSEYDVLPPNHYCYALYTSITTVDRSSHSL